MDTENLIKDVLYGRTWMTRDNSNTQVSPSLVDYFIYSQALEDFALKRLHSSGVSRAHREGSIYIHTLHSVLKPYCNGVDPRIFLLDGLRFPQCRSSPARHFNSAVYQSMAYMFYSQLFFAGAQAMDYYNWFLSPYLHHDKLPYDEVKQIIQGLVFQLNESNRTGAQSAFTNIGLRLKCPSYLKEQDGKRVPVIYQGRKIKAGYQDFEKEARMIYKAFMEVMALGDGSGLPFTFPIITTAITRDLDWSDPLWDLTLQTASEKGTPYFFNLTTDYLNEKYVHAMCCRLLVTHSGGVWQAGGIGSGSNKVVSLNLPHIALLAGNEGRFFQVLDQKMELARKALLESNQIIKRSLDEWEILPLLKMKTKDGAPYYNFKERKLTFGVVGLDECLRNLGYHGLLTREGFEVGANIISHISNRISDYSRKDSVSYNLEQTPAESASHKLALLDRKRFGKRANMRGSGGQVYYTNSTHIPYQEDISIMDKAETEAKFHPLFTGGTICHIWMGESRPPVKSLKNLVRKLAATELAYFTFSPDFSICMNEHISRGRQNRCPLCRAKIQDHMNRIVGYFTRTSRWNPGKQQEFQERKRYRIA